MNIRDIVPVVICLVGVAVAWVVDWKLGLVFSIIMLGMLGFILSHSMALNGLVKAMENLQMGPNKNQSSR